MSGQSYVRISDITKLSDVNQFSLHKDLKSSGCVLSCCFSCSFCSFMRASAKERSKSRSLSEQNKACQRCMLCKSMSFCPFCSQCPQCCFRTECRGKVAKIVASLAKHGYKSSGSLYPQGWLHSSLQAETPFGQIPLGSKWLRQSNKESVFKRGSPNLTRKLVVEKVVVRSSLAFYNCLFLVPKPNRKRRPILDLSQLNVFLNTGTFKMETPETIWLSLQTGEWVTSLHLATHTSTSQLPKGQGSISGSFCSNKPSSSQLSPSVWPLLHWSSPRWSRR